MILMVALVTSSCALLYEPDVQQGNVITRAMLDKLKPGMTQEQVQFVMGSPLVQDPFHRERWDYYYAYLDKREDTFEQRGVTLLFEQGRLTEIKLWPQDHPLGKPPEPEVIIEPTVHEHSAPPSSVDQGPE